MHVLGPRDDVMKTIIALSMGKITCGGWGLNHKLIRMYMCMGGRRRLVGIIVVVALVVG